MFRRDFFKLCGLSALAGALGVKPEAKPAGEKPFEPRLGNTTLTLYAAQDLEAGDFVYASMHYAHATDTKRMREMPDGCFGVALHRAKKLDVVSVGLFDDTGNAIVVGSDGDLIAAIERAKPGDTIWLMAGTICTVRAPAIN